MLADSSHGGGQSVEVLVTGDGRLRPVMEPLRKMVIPEICISAMENLAAAHGLEAMDAEVLWQSNLVFQLW